MSVPNGIKQNMLQAFIVSMVVIAIIASSGCVGGGGNVQTFDTNFGQIQIKTPETLERTFGSISGQGALSGLSVLSLGKKGSGMPLLIITLTENNELTNFQNSVSVAQIMMQNGRFLTTNDNHKMYWASTQLGSFKQYEGFIDYGNDKGLFVDIKGLSETVDPSTGKSVPGFSESEYLDIFKSFAFVKNSGSTAKTSVSNIPSSEPVSTKPENIVLGPYTMSFDLGNVGAYSINVMQPEEKENGTSYSAEIMGKGSPPFNIWMGIMASYKPKPADIEDTVRKGLEGEDFRKGLASNAGECGKATIVARTIDGKPGTVGSITCSDAAYDMIFYPLDYFPEDNTMTSIVAIVSAFPVDESTSRDEAIASLVKTIHVEMRGNSNAASGISATPSNGLSSGINNQADSSFTKVQPTDHFILPPNGQESGAFHMVVIGDSIAWGNGLLNENKYSYLVADWLQKKLNKPVDVTVYAHSGATISGESGGSIDPNLNSGTPTLMDQARSIKDKDKVNLILVSGGINDVGLSNILDANTPAERINRLSESIKEPMMNLLTYLLDETDAKIIVTGYYHLITEDSKVQSQDRIIAGLLAMRSDKTLSQSENVLITAIANPTDANIEAAWYLLEGSINNVANIFTHDANLRANSDTFYAISSNSLEAAVNAADRGQNRIKFIDPMFERDNSYRASDSFLWQLDRNLRTNDDQYSKRVELTEDKDLITKFQNNINAMGHPNSDGAAKYAHTIESLIENSNGINLLQNSDTAISGSSANTASSSASGDDISTSTKTAYTQDGMNFISKARMEQNIKLGLAKSGDYKEVQVPLDTVIVDLAPGET